MEAVNDLNVRALTNPDLVAIALLSLRRASSPVDHAPSPSAAMELPLAWPCRLRRPRSERHRWISDGAAASWEVISDSKDAAASRGWISVSKDAAASRGWISDSMYASVSRRRLSPITPLEYNGSSGTLQSASEEIARNQLRNVDTTGSGGGAGAGRGTKVVAAVEREQSIPNPKPIGRSSAKKKLMVTELQTMHQSLLEHREFLQKHDPEVQWRSKVALVAKNQDLKRQKGVVAGEREQSIPNPKPIGRSSAKKKLMLTELQAMHQSLLEHREFLQKDLEVQWKSKVALVVKNQDLKRQKLTFESQKRPSTAVPVHEEVHPKRLRLCENFVPLPDLNISLFGELD